MLTNFFVKSNMYNHFLLFVLVKNHIFRIKMLCILMTNFGSTTSGKRSVRVTWATQLPTKHSKQHVCTTNHPLHSRHTITIFNSNSLSMSWLRRSKASSWSKWVIGGTFPENRRLFKGIPRGINPLTWLKCVWAFRFALKKNWRD